MPTLPPKETHRANPAPADFFAKKKADSDAAFKEAIRTARESADIVSIIDKVTPLKKSGQNYMGLCPFHRESTASFSVNGEKGVYKCFGCPAKGDAISFLEQIYGMSFTDALKSLLPSGTNIHGNPDALALIPRTIKLEEKPSRIEISPEEESACYDALDMADRHFAFQLSQTPEPMAYLTGRHISQEMFDRFAIGFAPNDWKGLANIEAFADYANNVALAQAGLIRDKEVEAKEPTTLAERLAARANEGASSVPKVNRYDYFRNRITYGIRDMSGRVIGFGARTMGDDKPKYLNSPETALFRKRESLFGLYEARSDILSFGIAIVVEGYMDAIGLAQAGLPVGVSSMGIAISPEQLELLTLRTPEVVFMFDPDEAGQRASWAALKSAMAFAGKTLFRFATPPDGLDPDEWAIRDGAVVVERYARSAPTLSQFLIKGLSSRHDVNTPEGRQDLLAEGREIISSLPSDSSLYRLLDSQISILGRDVTTTRAKIQPLSANEKSFSAQPKLSHMPVEARLIEAASLAPGIAHEMRPIIARAIREGVATEYNAGADEANSGNKDVGTNWITRFDAAIASAESGGSAGPGAGMDVDIATQILQSGAELAFQIGGRLAKRQAKQKLDERLQRGEINTAEYFKEVTAAGSMRVVHNQEEQERPAPSFPRERG